MPRTFPTAHDSWLVLLVFAAIAVPWILLVWQAQSTPIPMSAWLSVAGVNVFVLALLRLSAWPVDYTIDDGLLVVRSGLIKYRVVLGSIVRVEPTRSPLSSPAWSLDRLRVVFRTGETSEGALLLSPADKAGFVRALEEACGRELRPA